LNAEAAAATDYDVDVDVSVNVGCWVLMMLDIGRWTLDVGWLGGVLVMGRQTCDQEIASSTTGRYIAR